MEVIETFHAKIKNGILSCCTYNSKNLSQKIFTTVVEMHQLADIEKIDCNKETSCLKWTKNNGRKKVCAYFKADADSLNIVVQRYRSNLFFQR